MIDKIFDDFVLADPSSLSCAKSVPVETPLLEVHWSRSTWRRLGRLVAHAAANPGPETAVKRARRPKTWSHGAIGTSAILRGQPDQSVRLSCRSRCPTIPQALPVRRHGSPPPGSRQMIGATPWGQHPRCLILDRDRGYGANFATRLARLGIESIRTPV